MSSLELSHLARVWSRGQRAFKRAFVTTPADPVTKHIEVRLNPEFFEDQSPEAVQLKEIIEECEGAKMAMVTEKFATEKTARFARFQIILCLGEKILEAESPSSEEAR